MALQVSNMQDLQRLLDRTIAEKEVPDPSNPLHAYRYLEARRRMYQEQKRQRPLLRLWDKNMNFIGTIAQEKSVRVEELMADSGTATCVIRRDNWLSDFMLYDRRAEEDLHFTLDPIPTNRSWRNRWGGKVTAVNAKRSSDGLHTVEMEMIHNREHVKHILGGANPIFPPEIQFPKMFILPWNCRTAVSMMLFINLARQFFPLLSIPTNIFNPGAWLGVANIVGGFDPLLWPIQVQFLNPATDQSRTEILTARWNDMHTITADALEDSGCMIRAYTFLTEDKESPHPELHLGLKDAPFIGPVLKDISEKTGLPTDLDEIVRPQRNAVILAVEDKSGVTGPTGTFLDGPINLIASTADDLITETLSSVIDLDKDGDGKTDPLIRKWLGVAPKPPWVVFKDGEYSQIVESQRSMHGATAKTVMVGGKSPSWVNQLQTFAIKYGLSQISAAIMYVAPGGLAAYQGNVQVPGSPGLEELYQGQLDDVLLAYQRFTDPVRAIRMGDFGFLEHFETGGSGTAYTVSGVLSLRTGHWKTRAYTSFKTSVSDIAGPYYMDVDYTLGDRLGFQMGNVIHVDQMTGYRRSYDESKPMTIELTIGSDAEERDPVAKGMAVLGSVWNLVGSFLGSEGLF